MSATVDSRIVTMKFDNALFEQKVSKTMSTLDKLKAKLQFDGAKAGLDKVGSALSKIGLRNPFASASRGVEDLNRGVRGVPANISQIEGGITKVSAAWLAMTTVALTALSNVVNRAVDAGARIGSSFTLDPIKQGFGEYELKLGSIQTILANTSKYGTTLKDVTSSLNELNHYADKTIYNFGDMTKNIGLFTNAGLKLEDSTSMIKGFSNEAAASGASAEQAAHAAQQLSQGLSTGTIRAMDWFSLTNAGMGNSNMKDGLVQIADAMGTFNGKTVDANGANKDFKGSLEQGWLTTDVMSSYLKIMAGDMDEAKMKTIGLSDAQIEMFKKQQKTAEEAATKVRTITQLMGTMKEAIGSGWAQTFETVFGNFDEATDLFTDANNFFSNAISKSANARDKVLNDWDKRGGRTVAIDAIRNAFQALMSVLDPIRQGFRDIFPKQTGKTLYDLTVRIRDFFENLKANKGTMENIRSIAGGFFAVFDIGWQILKRVVGMFFTLFETMGGGQGHILDFAGSIGDFLVSLDDAIKNGGLLNGFFEGLGSVLEVPMMLLGKIAKFIGHTFSGFDGSAAEKFQSAMDSVGNSVEPLSGAGKVIMDFFDGVGEFLKNAGGLIAENIQKIGDVIANAVGPGSFDKVLDIIQTGLLGGIFLLLKNFFKKGLSIDVTGGIGDSIKETLGSVTDTMKSMQQQIKADVILKIAGALALLTASIYILSGIDGKKLTKALVGLSAGLGGLSGGLIVLSKFISMFGAVKLPLIAGSMVLMAGAMLVLAVALKMLAKVPWDDLLKGVTTIGILLAEFAAFAIFATLGVSMGLGFMAMAIGIRILASAIGAFAELSWQDISKGLAAIAAAMVLLSVAMRLMPKNLAFTGAGLLMVGLGLKAIASAVGSFGDMSPKEIAKGILAMAGSLAVIATAMYLFPATTPLIAAGLVILSIALGGIARSLEKMGKMKGDVIAKGLIALGGALLVLAVGLNAIGLGGIVGAAALLIAAAALAIFVPLLGLMGQMDWSTIIKGLVTLALAFTIIGVAGYLLGPVVPILVLFGAALLLIGAAFALAGAGAFLFATAFAIIVASGTAGIAIFIGGLKALIDLIPYVALKLAEGVLIWVQSIATSGPKFVEAMTKILISMLDSVIQAMPKIRQAMGAFVSAMLGILIDNIPKLVTAGMRLMLGVLKGIDDNIEKITNRAASIVRKFLKAFGDKLPGVIQAGVTFIIKFLNGLSKAIDDNSEKVGKASGRLGVSIVKGMIKGVLSFQDELWSAVRNLAGGAIGAIHDAISNPPYPSREGVKLGGSLAMGFIVGVQSLQQHAERAGGELGEETVDSVRRALSRVSDVLSEEMNTDITIAPVLDLTQLTKDANSMQGLITPPVIAATVSYDSAATIATDREQAQEDAAENPDGQGNTYVNLEQNNYSPKELSNIDIYRGTKNQMSLAKEALNA